MKTLSKKLLTACLALMVAVVMAVPAFAVGTYAASTGYRKRKTGTHYTLCN